MLALVAAPGTSSGIKLEEVGEPEPSRDEAIVDVRCVSVNRGEVRMLGRAQPGWRPGWDVAGVVSKPAGDGSGPPAGTRVVGIVRNGGWAQRVAVPARQLAPLPEALTFAAASALPVAGLTAYYTLAAGGLLLGKRVLITGASGGVGRFAVQLAARARAHVIAVSANPERARGLGELGANEIVHTLSSDGPPLDLILESAGGASLAAALLRVAPGGTIMSYGNSAQEPTTFDVSSFYSKGGNSLRGFLLFPVLAQGTAARDLGYLATLVAERALDTQISLEASWRDPAPVLKALMERKVTGKAVLHVD